MGIVLTPSVYKAKPVLNKTVETGQQVQNDLQQGGWQQQGGGWQQGGGSWQQQGGGWQQHQQQLGSGWQQQGGGWQGSGWGPVRGSQWSEGTGGVAEDQLQGRDAPGVDDKAASAQAAEGTSMYLSYSQNISPSKIGYRTDTVCFTCMLLYVSRMGDGYPLGT
jgi:hypothetical protein